MSENFYNDEVTNKIASVYVDIISELGENPNREGLLKTPERVAKSLQYLTHGYEIDPEEILKSALFEEEYSEMVIVKNVEVYSMCEHHMLPFFGKAHIAYISTGKVIGLSKLNRIVQYYAQRPQVQERLTKQIAKEISQVLKTDDVAVKIDACHLCVASRGIKDTHSSTVTVDYLGAFLNDIQKRNEFLRLLEK